MRKIIRKIRGYLVLRKMIREKESALIETIWDIEYFEVCKKKYSRMTVQEEKDIRVELQAELKKEESKRDNKKIRDLLFDVEEYKKVQSLYETSKKTRDELRKYIQMLKNNSSIFL